MSSGDSKKRLVRSRSGLRFINLEEGNTSPFELREPFWIPDEESPSCMKCQAKFDFLTRRHHCRRCGNIFCKNCCENKAPLPRMCFIDPVRVCDGCLEVTKKENEFYEKHLKTLLSGANFILSDPDKPDTDVSFLCYLSSNHQSLMFDGGSTWQHDPVPLTSVASMKVLGVRGSPGAGSPQINGAVFTYTDANKELHHMYMSVANVPNRVQSVAWVTALQKAFKFLNPSPESP